MTAPGPWTCFHCGEVCTTPEQARLHFGVDQNYDPGCITQVQDGGLLAQLRAADAECAKLRAQVDQLDNDAACYHATVRELKRYFEGARTAHQAFLVLDFMEGRALAAEGRLLTFCKDRSKYVRPDGGCLACDADAGEACLRKAAKVAA